MRGWSGISFQLLFGTAVVGVEGFTEFLGEDMAGAAAGLGDAAGFAFAAGLASGVAVRGVG